MTTQLILTPAEIREIAGDLTQPRRQLAELHRQGFWRSRLGRNGAVVLERAHYEAVCAGAVPPGTPVADRYTRERPTLAPIT